MRGKDACVQSACVGHFMGGGVKINFMCSISQAVNQKTALNYGRNGNCAGRHRLPVPPGPKVPERITRGLVYNNKMLPLRNVKGLHCPSITDSGILCTLSHYFLICSVICYTFIQNYILRIFINSSLSVFRDSPLWSRPFSANSFITL